MRGGSAWNDADNCRSAIRNRNHPSNRNINIGFRVAFPFEPAEPGLRAAVSPSRPAPLASALDADRPPAPGLARPGGPLFAWRTA